MIRQSSRFKVLAVMLACAVQIAAESAFSCGVEWRKPLNHFEGVNEFGFVSYWEEIGGLDIGGGLKFPLILGFRSDWEHVSKSLGHGWFLGILDAHFVQRSSETFDMIQPDGYTVPFGRDAKNPSLLRGAKGWIAEINGDVLTAYASCGWKMTFRQGKLASITAPNGQALEIRRDAEGSAVAVADGAKTYLKVTRDDAGNAAVLHFGGGTIRLEQTDRPLIQALNGVNIVGAMKPALGTIVFPNGDRTSFNYTPSVDLQPTMTVSRQGAEPRTITWNAHTGHIASDGSWIYTIVPAEAPGRNAAIARNHRLTGETGSWHYDAAEGIDTAMENGVATVKTWFTSGKLAGKIRSIVRTENNRPEVAYRASYDEAGNFLRGAYANGDVVTFENSGGQKTMLVNGAPRLSTIHNADGTVAKEIFHDQKSEKNYLYKNGETIITTLFSNGEKLIETFDAMQEQVKRESILPALPISSTH